MANLTITTPVNFGPISVEVLAASGEPVGRSCVLSTGKSSTTLYDLAPGNYVIVGTRPSGERLSNRVTIGAEGRFVEIGSSYSSVTDLTDSAVSRGLLPRSVLRSSDFRSSGSGWLLDFRSDRIDIPLLPSSPGRSLQTVLTPLLTHEESFLEDITDFDPTRLGSADYDTWPTKHYFLCEWVLEGRKWRRAKRAPAFSRDPKYIMFHTEGGVQFTPRAFGMLDEEGFGPIVIAPPFRQGMTIAFLAEGLCASQAAERIYNPSAVRVPVAIAVPGDAGMADLLSALAAASMPNAQQLWQQDTEGRFGEAAPAALDMLLYKYQDPAAALLGAHFLSRFNPSMAPIAWLENLAQFLPNVADPLVLLATRLITEGSTEERKTSRKEIANLLREAGWRNCFLFARTRGMLIQARRLYGPSPQKPTDRRPIAKPRPRIGDFLNFGADAGGLEAFWGSNPYTPGRPGGEIRMHGKKIPLSLTVGEFRP